MWEVTKSPGMCIYDLVCRGYLPPMECWLGAEHYRHSSSSINIWITHRLLYWKRPRMMSCRDLNVKCLDWWQSVCTATTDSKSKTVHMRMNRMTIYIALHAWGHVLQWLICCSEACLDWNHTSKMIYGLSKLTWSKSRNIILDRIADLRCGRTSISVKDANNSKSCS